MKNVLITGGLGYIGSHIAVELLKRKDNSGNYLYNIFIVDNLENSSFDVQDDILEVTKDYDSENRLDVAIFDILKMGTTTEYFKQYSFDIIIHCAGKKSVSESIEKPLNYYIQNLPLLMILLSKVQKYNIKEFIFSSSATVYGKRDDNRNYIDETEQTGNSINNPYGKTKLMQEEMLFDFYKTKPELNCTILRYFNPIGCDPSGLLGENPKGIPNNLMPFMLRVASNNNTDNLFQDECYKCLKIFGDKYPTKDGTCVRDFIHVSDLANAHIDVLDFETKNDNNVWIFNVGTGIGTSVYELVETFIRENNINLNYEFSDNRDGDEVFVVCNNKKILTKTNWKPKYELDDIVRHNWNYILVNNIN